MAMDRIWLLLWLHVNFAANTASTDAINSTAISGSKLAATAVTTAAGPLLDQGLSKHQDVGFTPITKATKIIVVFCLPFLCNRKVDPER